MKNFFSLTDYFSVCQGCLISKQRVILLLILLLSTSLYAQTGTIAGKVTSAETKLPLEGANVTVQQTTFGTATSSNGEFRIENVPEGKQIIVVSLIGYTTKRITVNVEAESLKKIEVQLFQTILPGQTIVVEAVKAQERSSPVAFSNLNKLNLKERYTTQDMPILLSELPSSIFYSENGNGIGYSYLSLRGFDQKRISVMINGIPQNDPLDHNVYWHDFVDLASSLDNIQVQRGAGSAFYGPPAIGGSINLITSASSFEPSLQLQTGFGSYNTRRFATVVNSGLFANQYSVFARLTKIMSDGYREQSWTDFSSYYISFTRYDEKMTTQLNLLGGPLKDHLAYYGIPKADIKDKTKRRYNPIVRPEEIEEFQQPHYQLLNEIKLSDNLILNNTLFLVTSWGYFDFDGLWADTSYFRITKESGFSPIQNPDNALIRAYVDNRQWGWLPRISYKTESFDWTTGAELRYHRSDHYGTIVTAENLPANLPSDWKYYRYEGDKDIYSFYSQLYWTIEPELNVMTNLQLVHNTYYLHKEKFIGTEFKVPYWFLNPRVGVNYNITENLNTFINVSYTSREPRMDDLYEANESSGGAVPKFNSTVLSGRTVYDFSSPLVKPENLLDVEFGIGYTDEKLKLNGTIYDMEFTNEIVKKGGIDIFGQPRTGNAERSRHTGIEVSVRFEPIPKLELNVNATASSNKLIKHTEYKTVSGVVVPYKLDGNRISGFPDLLANFRLTYRHNGITGSLAGKYVGDRYTDNFQKAERHLDEYFTTDAYIIVDLKVLTEMNLPALRFDVNNILNTYYATHGIGDEFFPAADRNVFVGMVWEF